MKSVLACYIKITVITDKGKKTRFMNLCSFMLTEAIHLAPKNTIAKPVLPY